MTELEELPGQRVHDRFLPAKLGQRRAGVQADPHRIGLYRGSAENSRCGPDARVFPLGKKGNRRDAEGAEADAEQKLFNSVSYLLGVCLGALGVSAVAFEALGVRGHFGRSQRSWTQRQVVGVQS
jgi:hypothetical protein